LKLLETLASNGVFIAVVAHGLIGLSLVWDKVLLKKPAMQNVLSYVFWLGCISIFGLLLIPFGFKFPGFKLAGLGFVAGLLDLIASYFYYLALQRGEASEELAAMGGFTPIATALLSIPLLKAPFGGSLLGFFLMAAGGLVMFFAETRPLKTMLPMIAAASVGFGLMNVLQKIVFNQTNFISGYVFFTIGTTVGSLLLLVPPSWRKQVFEHSEQAPPSSKFWYMFNRFTAGVGSFLVVFAVSKASPSIVTAISGVRYVIIFVLAYAITRWMPRWFRENFTRPVLLAKSLATALIVAGLVLAGLQGGPSASGPS
jgi:drug/metabolite transporter (DMT)-like permease